MEQLVERRTEKWFGDENCAQVTYRVAVLVIAARARASQPPQSVFCDPDMHEVSTSNARSASSDRQAQRPSLVGGQKRPRLRVTEAIEREREQRQSHRETTDTRKTQRDRLSASWNVGAATGGERIRHCTVQQRGKGRTAPASPSSDRFRDCVCDDGTDCGSLAGLAAVASLLFV